jgi:hypothetical protein
MAGVSFIKTLDMLTPSDQLVLTKIIYGDTLPKIYIESNTYNIGDKCLIKDGLNFILYECNDNNVTGVFNITKWDVYVPLMNTIDCGSF